MKKILILIFVILSSCSLEKVTQHHGIHNLELKQKKLKINYTNKNDIVELMGPPSIKNTFDTNVYIYIERKTTGSKLSKLGKKKLLKNDVLVLEIDNNGILLTKNFYNKDDMNEIKFDEKFTNVDYEKKSFIYNFLSSLRQKIDDPLGKKRIKN
tara:strand:+ start:6628 stop:7089 length:462 start_codon:yes stop_codon:yes gene_type:complete